MMRFYLKIQKRGILENWKYISDNVRLHRNHRCCKEAEFHVWNVNMDALTHTPENAVTAALLSASYLP